MTSKEYFQQAPRLERRINSDIQELEELRKLTAAVSSPSLKEHVQTSRCTDAPFEQAYMRIVELEQKINDEIGRLAVLKEEMHDVISQLVDLDEQTVLVCRYLRSMTWEAIAMELHASRATVNRWHNTALEHIRIPRKDETK